MDCEPYRKGNVENIQQASTVAWKSSVAVELQRYAGTPVLQDLLAKDDVLDGNSFLSELATEIKRFQEKSLVKPRPLQSGRKRAPQEKNRMETLQKKLRLSQERGDVGAELALEKLKAEVQEQEAAEAAACQAENKKKKKPAKKRKRRHCLRYTRKAGDEMRLIRKREIATCLAMGLTCMYYCI